MVQAAEMRQPIKHPMALHGSALRGILVVNTRAFTPKTGDRLLVLHEEPFMAGHLPHNDHRVRLSKAVSSHMLAL
jgi:hypothetical protein